MDAWGSFFVLGNPSNSSYKLRIRVDPIFQPSGILKLFIKTGEEPPEGFVIPPIGITIGRGSMNDLQIEGQAVSETHARVVPLESGEFEIIDSNSTNGTLVDGKRIERKKIGPGDRITFGLQTGLIASLGETEIEAGLVSAPSEEMTASEAGPDLSEEVAALKSQLEIARIQLREAENENAFTRDESTDLRSKLEETTASLRRALDESAILRSEAAPLKARLEVTAKSVQNFESELNIYRKEASELRTRLDASDSSLVESREKLAEAEHEITLVRKEADDLRSRLDESDSTLEISIHELAEAKSETELLKEKVEYLKSEKEKRTLAAENLSSIEDKRAAALHAIKNADSERKSINLNLAEAKERAKAEHEKVKSGIAAEWKRLKELTREIKRAEAEASRHWKACDAAEALLKSRRAEIDRLDDGMTEHTWQGLVLRGIRQDRRSVRRSAKKPPLAGRP